MPFGPVNPIDSTYSQFVFNYTHSRKPLCSVAFGHITRGSDDLKEARTDVLLELLQDVPIVIRKRMWFQHDGAPANFSIDVRNYLNATFAVRWIGRGGPVP
ncbi:hypothetical protein AVEN_21990-1 [Araneus ventricosus]|uniref:Uncharacterized protein n=1 Tax=Araneus ventricosus TaxID=182803 RepID=A0A4Y2JCD3_ARAVE|nr:hypothetical protein AVEN_21990-1 [Araneus ventricosus]